MTDFYIKLIEKSGFEEALVRRSLDLATQIDIHTLSRLFFDENPCSLSDTGVLFLKEAFYPFGFYDELKKICLPIEEASLYVYILLLEKAYDSFLSAINNETIFFDTAKRIAESAREYFHDNGKYGLYDYHFLANHVRGSILRLGEFEYQYSVTKNKKSITLHVPNGANLEKSKRTDSYSLARCYFGNHPIIGDSWLLYPPLFEMLSEDSKILDFARDFDILSVHETNDYKELFHIFGRDADYNNPQTLPQKTSLQKAFAEKICNGLKIGSAVGVLKY